MIRLLAKIWAKLAYRFKLEKEAATNEINAALSSKRAAEKRQLVEQLNAEADAIQGNIAKEEETEEYKKLAGQEKYEADREKNDAKKIVADKRASAKTESEAVSEGEKTAQYFRQLAANSRIVAEKIRRL